MSGAYYNEFNPEAAEWLRQLIKQGHIADGEVDERSIEDVLPADLKGFVQCHFFAGIGVWSYALRRAGWDDSRPVWTGSAPCQPFSAAGKGAAFDDERHLWPAFHHLIKVGKPAIVLGEQVASAAVDAWIDLVHADLEALGYTFGSIPFPSAGVGAPHIRDRNYWAGIRVGNPSSQGLAQRQRHSGILSGSPQTTKGEAAIGTGIFNAIGLADNQLQQRSHGRSRFGTVDEARGRQQGTAAATGLRGDLRSNPTNGYWTDADWLHCRDGKWRPVEPGTFPLVDGAPARVGRGGDPSAPIDTATAEARVMRLRGYGNAINAAAAQAWIETVMECIP